MLTTRRDDDAGVRMCAGWSRPIRIGPILMGLDKPAYVLTPAATSRRIINMSAIAAVEAQIRAAISARPA